ncbi:esterase-like activity of phytase family protein [Sphingomonas sp.]|uniref:esterase-like activity of phytase family protein n=1 Tax=Sphingomonas sp. TaxID=28214 RepID=UPI0017BE8B97|nr:esterase-like activity of phytase family protein [Sphingomonas sp.]MBA3510491.1 esterase-like activity of phytase family protein [Sphingomonas sp.]
MDLVEVVPLRWRDDPIAEVDFPGSKLVIRHGIGSGLSRDRSGGEFVWAIADRGPNLELRTAIDDYGWQAPESCRGEADAKLMPRLELGPYLARLRIHGEQVELDGIVRLTDARGTQIPGCPVPDGDHFQCEPAFDFDGRPIPPDPLGMDTEGIAALSDGGFWVGEEYGPSLVQVAPSGRVVRRLVPKGSAIAHADHVEEALPALAARRHLNRGFEAVAASPSEDRLFLAFQSPLSHPDKTAFERARHVRLWELDRDGRVLAQYLYPFDEPDTFVRDVEKKKLGWKDLKICELTAVGERSLLVLERSTETCKIYRIELADELRVPAAHLDVDTRPTIEELSAMDGPFDLPVLAKQLLFTSDDHPEVSADIEGMTPLSERSLLLVSDNDFGVQDKATRFFRLSFASPLGG